VPPLDDERDEPQEARDERRAREPRENRHRGHDRGAKDHRDCDAVSLHDDARVAAPLQREPHGRQALNDLSEAAGAAVQQHVDPRGLAKGVEGEQQDERPEARRQDGGRKGVELHVQLGGRLDACDSGPRDR
jgi:hypothetical protein